MKCLFNFLDTLTVLDISCMVVMYLLFSFLIINIWINFKLANIAEYLHSALFVIMFLGGILLYFFEKDIFNLCYKNIFVKLTCISNIVILFIYSSRNVIKRYQQNKIFRDVKSYSAASTTEKNTTETKKNYKNIANNDKGTYDNYNYYYNNNDKYAEPYTSRPNNDIAMKNEIERLNKAIDDVYRAINNRTYDDKNEKEIKLLQEKLQVLQSKVSALETKSEDHKTNELENFEKQLQIQKEKNENAVERNKDMIREVKDEINNIKQNVNNINHNVNYIRNENSDMYGSLKRQIDILKNNEEGNLQKLKNQLETKKNILITEQHNQESAINIRDKKLDAIDRKIDEIIDKNKELTTKANNFGNEFGERLAMQLEKLTETIENEKKLANEKEKQELLKQKAEEDLKRQQEITNLQNEINALETKYEQQKNKDDIESDNSLNDIKLDQVVPYNEKIEIGAPKSEDKIITKEENKKTEIITKNSKDKVIARDETTNIIVKSNENGNIIAEKTFDISAFEEGILDKVKHMLRENNASLDEKFGLIRVDMGNLKDGVQGVVDRMTKLFELLTVTLQNNKNHPL